MKLWLVPNNSRVNKMCLVETHSRPPEAYAEWPKGWHPMLSECVEVQVPPGKVSINQKLLMQVGKKKPLVFSEARKTGHLVEVPDSFWSKLKKRFGKKWK